MTHKVLHFTLGPVQGFIADARRTRDLWAGSFLLSWLSGQAMAALCEQGGSIVFPKAEGDELYESILSDRCNSKVEKSPFIGSLPNRFKADVTNVEGDAGEICKSAISEAWNKLAGAVYAQFIAGRVESLGIDTKRIWDRQVDQFWDMTWVIGDEPGSGRDGSWLDQRKNWRAHYAGKNGLESGDLCRLMGVYQEISGHSRLGSKGEGSKAKQQAFWKALSEVRGIGSLDLKADERLCAIALIKRLFPRLSKIQDIVGWIPGGNGQMDIVHWPSVSYIAALPWLKATENLKSEQQNEYWENADQNLASNFMGETSTKLFGLPVNGLFKLDGHLLHRDGISAWPTDDLKGETEIERTASRQNLMNGLIGIEKAVGARASEFYAMLLMDGDSIGARLGECPNVVKDGLASFTDSVKSYFGKPNPSNGVLIYAGGDDVMAVVPLDTAIQAALDLRALYSKAFKDAFESASDAMESQLEKFTMSAALIYAQYKIPVRRVLSHAHHYLYDVAKEQNGRDSLAVAVAKPGGVGFQWVSMWSSESVKPVETLKNLAMETNKRQHVSSGLFYNLKTRYEPLFDTKRVGDQDDVSVENIKILGDATLLRALIEADLARSGKGDNDIAAVAEQLITIGKPLCRKNKEEEVTQCDAYQFDSGLVARFLSVEGRGKLLGDKPL